MERTFEQVLDKIAATEGVDGVVIADEQGLCLGSRGIGKASVAGYITSIAHSAKQLAQQSNDGADEEPSPVITVETTIGIITVKNDRGYTLGVFRTKKY